MAQAAAWAKQLGRTFVEPVYCRSRVVPPFKSLQEAGPAVQRALGAAGAQWTCPGQDKERLGATREVHDMWVFSKTYFVFMDQIKVSHKCAPSGAAADLRVAT